MVEIILLKDERTHELIYRTPDGDMTQEEYLTWIGNKFIELEKNIKKKK